ncbi:Crp/Fnr family transcriptional regulator [Fusibacter sp. 3D3]|uniref:Crp/Fnr family transcriptional regulator n=1 Tax=Fusibacter sp. 3D3 TaxID=1048380 RepID=UPI00085844DC|nr:Crp/Fnr family transcriptional regulator [Fusibacter sp. 3D3]GAU76641.1 Hcp transcriptional regulator HcpR [Fusibacter sp. 3D3]
MKNTYLDVLKSSNLFTGFSTAQLETIIKRDQVSIKSFKAHNIIHLELETCTHLDFILEGKVIIQQIDINGNLLTMTEFSAGDNIGGNVLFSQANFYPMTIIALTDVVIMQFSKSIVLKFCQTNQSFLENFLMSLSDKSFILTQKIKVLSTKSIREMCLDFIENEFKKQNQNPIMLPLSKKALSEKLGIQRTSLSRVLTQLQLEGYIEYSGRSIKILKKVE